MKKLSLLLALIFLSAQVHAIYVPPKALRLEIKANKQIAEAQPTSADAQFNLAMSYAYTGRILEGWDSLKKVHKLDKNYAPAVVKKYTDLIEKNPDNWKYHFKLAFGYYFLEDKEQAKDAFKHILTIDPEHIWAMGYIALLEGEQKHYDKSIEWCRKALKIEPDATAIHFLYSEALGKKGDFLGSLGEKAITLKLMAEDALFRNDDQ